MHGSGVGSIDISLEEMDRVIDEVVSDTNTLGDNESISEEPTESMETSEETSLQQNIVTECSLSDLTCSALNDPDYAVIVSDVEQRIASLVSELDNLYRYLEETDAEYNEYLGASNISTLSTVAVTENVNVQLYTVIAAIFFLIICTCGAVLIGRINDIVRYIFYTDHMTGLNNRTAFDNYLKQHDHRILDNGIACVTVTITNQVTINRRNGRDGWR